MLNIDKTQVVGGHLSLVCRNSLNDIKVRPTSKYSFNFHILFHSHELAINEISKYTRLTYMKRDKQV